MSVNITVNGKYTKSCPRHNLLNDPERVRKEAENERRKMRIQQVRAVSKDMAKKVRNDVELEKERQLRKIEEIKAQEMEMWRQNVLGQQQRNFRSAIFQIGSAHRAAQVENAKQTQKNVQKNTRKPLKHSKNVMSTSKVGKENVFKNANVQTDITGKCYPKPSETPGHREFIEDSTKHLVDSNEVCSSNSDEETSTCSTSELSSEFLQSSTTMSESSEIRQVDYSVVLPEKIKSITKQKGKVPSLKEVQTENDQVSKKNTLRESRTESNKTVPKQTEKKQKCQPTDKERFKSATEAVLSGPSTSGPAKKRFTQISDIIRQQKSSDEVETQTTPPPQKESQTIGVQQSPTKSKCRLQKSSRKTPSKSPTSSRPVSTQTNGLLAPNSTQSQQSSAVRVQFYDYSNKFEKEYEQPPCAVEIHEPSTDGTQMNAMEQAKLADKLREVRELEMEKSRQRSDERCQKAIEREQVRRACEDLTAKLDALTKQRQVLPTDNHQFSSLRLGQVAAAKETKLNNAVEDILRRPAIITCPVVNPQQPNSIVSSSDVRKPHAYDLNLGAALPPNEMHSLNASDSCCSILLGYVNGQSKQVADDIKKCNSENLETNKAKAEKLQNLLSRINRLRENLIHELEKCSTSTADKERVQTMVDSISEFRKERENILIDVDSKDSISKRESDLKKKEAILEKRVKEFYEVQKAAQKKKGTRVEEEFFDVPSTSKRTHKVGNDKKESEESNKSHKIESVEDESESLSNSPKMSQKVGRGRGEQKDGAKKREVRKNGSNIMEEKDFEQQKKKYDGAANKQQESEDILANSEDSEESEDEFVERRKLEVGDKPVEIIIKLKSVKNDNKVKKISAKSPRRLSTLIQSATVKKNRRKLSAARSSESSSTSYRSLPPTISNNVDEILKNGPKSVNEPISTDAQPPLQGQEDKNKTKKSSTLNPLMAHYVQRLLGMSRSSINALGVNSSEIETPSSSILNTTANLSAAETERLASNRLKHIQKFLEDNYSFVGELEDSLRQSNSADSSLKTFEVIWKKSLKEQISKTKYGEKGSQTETDKPFKSTLKKVAKKQMVRISQGKERNKIADKSTQSTKNCTQRIAELTEMINKVRQEKQKILETTLSSASENGRNSTEYMELPDRRNNSGESTSRILDSQLVKSAEQLATQSPDIASQLEKNKLTGMSRDSGISLSRPITVQDSPDSPTEELPQGQSSTESLSAQFNKPKPPVSIARYSPQLVEDVPHELSTIFEVDTPATSKINTSIHANNGQEHTAPQLQDERAQKITYRKFPTFEEYTRLNKLDMSQFDPEFSIEFEKEFNEFINLAKAGKVMDYEEFSPFSKYFTKSSFSDDKEAAEELLASMKLVNLSFKKFPTRKEYLDKIGVTSELLDSQSLDNIDENKNGSSNDSSTESLMNVEKELKLRKILTKSFRQNAPPDDISLSSTRDSVNLIPPREFPGKDNHQGDMSGIKQLTLGTTSSDEQSDNLENELKRLGIKWPSVMKKKTMETQALSSSNSSDLGQPLLESRRKPSKLNQTVETSFQRETYATFETTTPTEDGGRQLNLREFLTKELLKRTTTSSSFSFSDDSVASSILRSIIGSMTPSPQQQVNGAGPGIDRHKTSTPMTSHSTSSGRVASRSEGGASSVQLFSGESRLSSVHFSNSSKDIN